MPITVDETGVAVPSLNDTAIEKLVQLQAILGTDLSLAEQTPQAQIGGILAVASIEFGEALSAAVAGIHRDTATGAQLDALGSLLMLSRRAATRSAVTATLTGTAGTVVAAGSRAATPDGDTFETLTDANLSAAGVSVDMAATESGPVPAAAGALTRIVTVVAGWESVTNPAAAVVGAATETDAEYRAALRDRAARNATGPLAALQAALADADASVYRTVENATAVAVVVQGWTVLAHSILVVAVGGTDGDLRRAVENHKGMGVATTVAIFGAASNETALTGVSDGTVTWNGTAYTGLDLSAVSTQTARAAALTTLLAADPVPVTVVVVDGRYVAVIGWTPGVLATFGSDAVEDAFGLDPDSATSPAGPFTRARDRVLTVTAAVTAAAGFPAGGLNQIREAVTGRVSGYGIGESLWTNDLLVAAETVPGTRVTALTVVYDGTTLTGAVEPPLDARWVLPAANLTVTVT